MPRRLVWHRAMGCYPDEPNQIWQVEFARGIFGRKVEFSPTRRLGGRIQNKHINMVDQSEPYESQLDPELRKEITEIVDKEFNKPKSVIDAIFESTWVCEICGHVNKVTTVMHCMGCGH